MGVFEKQCEGIELVIPEISIELKYRKKKKTIN
jgi:hypothetical protein